MLLFVEKIMADIRLRDWIPTITGWPEEFIYQDMSETGKRLSAKLRDPQGEYKCDFVIALTHSRYVRIFLAATTKPCEC